jgi:hypothetical protein
MARSRQHPASPQQQQLTLDDWEQTLNAEAPPAAKQASVTLLADALAPGLAAELSQRVPTAPSGDAPSARLLTLDELVAQLPPAKRPQTWKRWLYERTRRGEIPGCVKLGGMLFFEREPALSWLRAGAPAVK